MKAFVAFIVLLVLLGAGGGGFFYWKKMERIEPRGVGLEIARAIPEDQKELLLKQYNLILDKEEVLMRTVEEHHLQKYYEVSSKEQALKRLKEDSFITLPAEKKLHILFSGKRKNRTVREKAARTLAEDFLKAARLADGN